MTMFAAAAAGTAGTSPFAGLDICSAAGLRLQDALPGPVFEQDVWDFSRVAGLPAYLQLSTRRLDFTVIANPAWRLVAKEHMAALLAPGHEQVRYLSNARRQPLAVTTCANMLFHLAGWLNWLTARGVTSLGEVTALHCRQWAEQYSRVLDDDGNVIGDRPGAYYTAITTTSELARYRELYTADRYSPGLIPRQGMMLTARLGLGENKTPVVPDHVLRPMLAAALYMTGVLGPHIITLLEARRSVMRERRSARKSPRSQDAVGDVRRVISAHVADGRPLDRLPADRIQARLDRGQMDEADPLLPVSVEALAREAGYRQSMMTAWLPQLRPALENAARRVGIAEPWGRDVGAVDRADGIGAVPWTLPLSDLHARGLADYLRTAAVLVIATVSGMRKSELCELSTGCCPSPREVAPGLVRYKIDGTLIKGQPLGGVGDEWTVTREVYDAVAIAERLCGLRDDSHGRLFGRLIFSSDYQRFRGWVNCPAGQRLGLAQIPPGPVNLRMLRRTLAVELAYRPAGLLAAKIQLKHVSVATTEGYAARPGGSQARFLAEVGKEEQQRNLAIIQAEYDSYKNGVMPSGPGARELAAAFAAAAGKPPGRGHEPPTVIPGDQQVRVMLARRARTLHLGPANYCWFTDPARALCLREAGTPGADQPLLAMCDSARCPQATHHLVHREIWADAVTQHEQFIAALPRSQKTEKARLEKELGRARHVLAGIDATTEAGNQSWDG